MSTDGQPSPLAPTARRTFERYLVLVIGAFGVLYTAPTLISLVAQWPSQADPLGFASAALAIGSVVVGALAGLAPRHPGRMFRAATALFLLALLLWPFAIRSAVPATPMPWFASMWPAEAGFLAIAGTGLVLPAAVSAAAAVFVGGVLYGVGGLDAGDAFADGFLIAAASGVMLLLVHSIRQGVARAEAAQHAALDDYGRTRFDDAAEAERIRTDALVHDSVITTFLAADAARTPEAEDLTRRMATNALRVLAHVNRTARMGPALPFSKGIADAADELAPLLPHFAVRWGAAGDVVLPVVVNQALIGAMVQAMAHGLAQGTPDAGGSVDMTELGSDGVRIVVTYRGHAAGLDRAALVDRLRRVDGRADIAEDAAGTRIVLSWGSVVVSGTVPLDQASVRAVSA